MLKLFKNERFGTILNSKILNAKIFNEFMINFSKILVLGSKN